MSNYGEKPLSGEPGRDEVQTGGMSGDEEETQCRRFPTGRRWGIITPMSPPSVSDAEVDRRVLRSASLIAAAFLAGVALVNALTLLTDAARAGRPLDPPVPWILEYSSVTVLAALVPVLALLERRFPLKPGAWRGALLAHATGSVVFSALHICGMIVLRKIAYAAILGKSYRFFDEPLRDLAYEYRKDLLTYATILLVLALLRGVEERRRETALARSEARKTGRLVFKSGGRTVWLDARSLHWAEAAANYVDVRANGATHLLRISLTALEQQLRAAGVDVVRVHRSRIVNRAKIMEIIPSRDGDFHVRMSDGAELKGSRRYRHLLNRAS